MEVCLVKRFVPFLITTVIVLLPIALFLTVQRGAFFGSKATTGVSGSTRPARRPRQQRTDVVDATDRLARASQIGPAERRSAPDPG